jgi:hypothetical protein
MELLGDDFAEQALLHESRPGVVSSINVDILWQRDYLINAHREEFTVPAAIDAGAPLGIPEVGGLLWRSPELV